jgi:hypothetical protein
VPLGSRADANAAPQYLSQAVGSHGDSQCPGRAPSLGDDGPTPHLGERHPESFSFPYLRFHRSPQTRTPLDAPCQPRVADPEIVKVDIARKMPVSGTSSDFPVSIHRQQVPALMIGALHVPTVPLELRSLQRPIRKVNTASYLLRFAQPMRVPVSIYAPSRKRSGNDPACGSQQDQLVVDKIAKSLQ